MCLQCLIDLRKQEDACVLIVIHDYGGISVMSEGERLSNYCRDTGDFYQRQTPCCSVKYLTEVMLAFAVAFLYGARDKISSSLKSSLFCYFAP